MADRWKMIAAAVTTDPDGFNAPDPTFLADVIVDMCARDRELERVDRPDPDYLRRHPDITAETRERVVSRMSEAHRACHLRNDTLFWAVDLFDLYMSKRDGGASEREARIAGCAALYVAGKVDEIYSMEPDAAARLHPGSPDVSWECTLGELLQVEKKLLQTVGWNVTFPTALHFLRRCSIASGADDEMHWMGKYLLNLFVHDVRSLRFSPSVAGAAAAYLTMRMFGAASAWTETMRRYSGGLSEADVVECAGLMYDLHRNGASRSKSLGLVVAKYAGATCGHASGNDVALTF